MNIIQFYAKNLKIKKNLPYLVTKNKIFYISLSILLLFLIFSLILEKEFLIFELNSLHNNFLDYFFKYITYLGDAIIYIPLSIFLWIKKRKLIFLLISLLITQTIFSILFKRVIFHGSPRPLSYFSSEVFETLYKIPGVKIYSTNSFISGHTLTAFSVAYFLILFFNFSKIQTFIILFLASLVGISRIYLLQHFFIDITFGAFFGFISAFIIYFFRDKIIEKLSKIESLKRFL